MGGGKKHGSAKDHTGHWVFGYQKKGEGEPWRMAMTLQSALRTSLEGYSKREWKIIPLVCCSISGMGVCYSLLSDEMTARVIPAGVPQIYSSKKVEIELGELKEADAVIQAAKEGFIKACEEGGTRHWFVRQLLMALDPINEKLTFCNTWMIQNVKARYLVDVMLEGKVMVTLEKSGKDFIVPSGQRRTYPALALKPQRPCQSGTRRRQHVSARARARAAEEAARGAEEAQGAPPPGEGQGEEAKEVGRRLEVISIRQRAPTYCVGPGVAAVAHALFARRKRRRPREPLPCGRRQRPPHLLQATAAVRWPATAPQSLQGRRSYS